MRETGSGPMQDGPRREFDALVARLRALWGAAIAFGVLAFALALWWAATGPGFDWIWGVMAFGVAVAVYNLAFFLLCAGRAPEMAAMVKDDTEIHGDSVTHVVEHDETGDPRLDAWIRTYATARGVSAAAIGAAVLMAIALAFF